MDFWTGALALVAASGMTLLAATSWAALSTHRMWLESLDDAEEMRQGQQALMGEIATLVDERDAITRELAGLRRSLYGDETDPARVSERQWNGIVESIKNAEHHGDQS